LIDVVYASGASAPAGAGGLFQSIIPILLIFGIFYFLLIRPQQKKAKEHREMTNTLKKGDRVITSGGIYGKVTHTSDPETVTIEIAEKVKVKCVRANIAALLPEHHESGSGKADDDKQN
jgi:preprotein translocase subunit YajC